MTGIIEIKDFIVEEKDLLFVYSVLIALESFIWKFFIDSPNTIDKSVIQASLICGIALLFFIWMKFIWYVLGQIHDGDFSSFRNTVLIAQNAVFAMLIGYPLFALLAVIYQMDRVNFMMSFLVVIFFILIFGGGAFIKFFILKINEEQRIIILFFGIIILAVIGYFWVIWINTPIFITDTSEIKQALNNYVFISLIYTTVVAILIAFLTGVYFKPLPPK